MGGNAVVFVDRKKPDPYEKGLSVKVSKKNNRMKLEKACPQKNPVGRVGKITPEQGRPNSGDESNLSGRTPTLRENPAYLK